MNKKVSELLEATSIKDEDVIMILQNGQNKKVQVNKLLPLKTEVITLNSAIDANENYTMSLKYKVGNNSLEVYYCDTKLKKDTDYKEIGEAGAISNIIQFTDTIGDLDMSGVEGFEDFKETLEFVVRGEYSV